MVGSAVGNAASGLLSKSVDSSDILIAEDTPGNASELEKTRSEYFDALLDAHDGSPGATRDDAQRRLAVAKVKYNDARRSVGLEQIN